MAHCDYNQCKTGWGKGPYKLRPVEGFGSTVNTQSFVILAPTAATPPIGGLIYNACSHTTMANCANT